MDFTDRHIIITGGTGSLGSAVTEQLLEAGAFCSIPCYDKSELEDISFKDHENIFIEKNVDLTNEEQAQSFYKSAIDKRGPLEASVNAAGGFGMGQIGEKPKSDFMKQINLNLVTCYNSCRAAVKQMRKSNGGRIVNVTARPALEPRQGKGMTAYTTAKAGVTALTESLAAEVIEDDILVNAIAPSVIDTPQNRESMPDADFDKWPKPEQLAKQILNLISPENEVTRGGIIPVYGQA